MGSLGRYYGENGRIHETREAYWEWMHGNRLAGLRKKTIQEQRDSTEQIRIEMACHLFIGLIERLTSELEATR